MSKLLIAEKPSVALRIALSLSDKPKRSFVNGVSYYELAVNGDIVYVVAAVGHLFTIKSKSNARGFPIFDTEWEASYKVSKNAYFTKKYLDVIENIGRNCNEYINACDYDIEGTVIGSNIIKHVMNKNVNSRLESKSVKRMRFSTTTKPDLVEAYAKINEFDKGNFEAGEARHVLDWMFGINLSRALMDAIAKGGTRRIASIGRVQGPALGLLAKREEEIKKFVPTPYWKLLMSLKGAEFENKRGAIQHKDAAEQALAKSKSGEVKIAAVEKTEQKLRPGFPFDLTSLQVEASRVFRLDPSRTLAITQSLYEKSYVSYPRTSSQKLPYTLNLPRIINELAKNPKYTELANELISKNRFKPAEGPKEDEAHPAIFPTGTAPEKLNDEESKIYDLVVKRFLACFAEYATAEKVKVVADASSELYEANGMSYKDKAWMRFYEPYNRKDEALLPEFIQGEAAKPDKIQMKEAMTKPPNRFSKASLIIMLEKKELGTKATRAEIIDTLFKREYVKGGAIEVTEFGMSIFKALSNYCALILDEELTRKLEADMEGIITGKATEDQVIGEGKEAIEKMTGEFKKNENLIVKSLSEGLKKSEEAAALGTCPKCGKGMLVIKRSKLGKNFVGCSSWPECNNAYPLPQGAYIRPTGKICDKCHTPFVKVFRRGKGVFEMDLDPNCETKLKWQKASEIKAQEQAGAAKPAAKEATAPTAGGEKPQSPAPPAKRVKPKKEAKPKAGAKAKKTEKKPAKKSAKKAE